MWVLGGYFKPEERASVEAFSFCLGTTEQPEKSQPHEWRKTGDRTRDEVRVAQNRSHRAWLAQLGPSQDEVVSRQRILWGEDTSS